MMGDEPRALGLDRLFQIWTDQIVFIVDLAILGAGVLGLVLSLAAFVRAHDAAQDPSGNANPLYHMIAAGVGGFVSVSGVVWGLSSLIFLPMPS